MLVAVSEKSKAWVMQEFAARYAFLGRTEKLKDMIDERGAGPPEHQQMMDFALEMAREQKKKFKQQKQDAAVARTQSVIKELKRRQARAVAAGNSAAAERYGGQISKIEGQE